jgi:hypothetical protein
MVPIDSKHRVSSTLPKAYSIHPTSSAEQSLKFKINICGVLPSARAFIAKSTECTAQIARLSVQSFELGPTNLTSASE